MFWRNPADRQKEPGQPRAWSHDNFGLEAHVAPNEIAKNADELATTQKQNTLSTSTKKHSKTNR